MIQPSATSRGFHHIAIRAFDFGATVHFYEEAIGCVRRFGWGEGQSSAALMDVGDGNYVEIFAGRDPGEVPEGGIIHFALRTDNADAAYARAVAGGAAPMIEPKDVSPANADHPITLRVAFVKGLNGEVIEFFQNDEL
ncbi:MAG: VOC family protein [Fimbriimonas sp.]|nr:VOC family protein [Fimbriimonas sp.]